jgi:anti-anti-sigma factor
METTYSPEQDHLQCHFSGELDSSAATEADEAVAGVIDGILGVGQSSESLRIVFDMSEVSYASSLFLRCVVATARRVARGNLEVVGCTQSMHNLFRVTSLDKLVNLAPVAEEEPGDEAI